jgi:DNA polymerase-3 subunit beta
MTTALATHATGTTSLCLDRKGLLLALQYVQAVIPSRSCKPIFTGVRLQATDGQLHIAATDGEVSLTTSITTDGELPVCVVPCAELIRRLKASKEPNCLLWLRHRQQRLILNGGRVEHSLPTLPEADFSPIATQQKGDTLTIVAQELRTGLSITGCAVAADSTRYAITGILLEVYDHGTRLVATDGRRLVVVELPQVEGSFRGQVIIPSRVAKLVERLADGEEAPLTIAIQTHATEKGDKLPSDLSIAGPDWLVSTQETDGRFPVYRDVIPQSQSRFVVQRQLLLSTLKEVMLAAGDCSRGVAVSLRPRSMELSASAPEAGTANAKLPARFIGGGDSMIHTGFNPDFLMDAVKSIPGERIVLDVGQNGYGANNSVSGRPIILYGQDDLHVRWVVMPVNTGHPTTREYLGSNYRENLAAAS